MCKFPSRYGVSPCDNAGSMSQRLKPVIARKFSREWCAGYFSENEAEGAASYAILDPSGRRTLIEAGQVKWLCFLRELPTSFDPANPERLLRRSFATRPRSAGLWLRLGLRDGDQIEGLAPTDQSLLLGASLLITPPDTRSLAQRLLIPRSAIVGCEVLGLITPPRHPRKTAQELPELFPSEAGNAESGRVPAAKG